MRPALVAADKTDTVLFFAACRWLELCPLLYLRAQNALQCFNEKMTEGIKLVSFKTFLHCRNRGAFGKWTVESLVSFRFSASYTGHFTAPSFQGPLPFLIPRLPSEPDQTALSSFSFLFIRFLILWSLLTWMFKAIGTEPKSSEYTEFWKMILLKLTDIEHKNFL